MKQHQPQGLTSKQAAENRRLYGANIITPPKGESVWKLFAEKFNDPIIRILMIAAALSLIVVLVDEESSVTELIGIFCAIILSTVVGFLFEYDAMRRFRRLNREGDDVEVTVMRDGAMTRIRKSEVVVGDVVFIETGQVVPADGTLVEAVSLSVNESTLTGEPQTEKTVDERFFDKEATYASNAVFYGTTVVDGYGVMEVTAVGDRTEFGKVAEQATVEHEEPTPLARQLERLSQKIGRVGMVLSGIVFVALIVKSAVFGTMLEYGWLHAVNEVLQIFMVAVAMVVMAMPEGLPMSITLSLALSMRRMLKTNNLVRKMHACETMGAATVICTDKTGTLTQNRMQVDELIDYGGAGMAALGEMIAVNTTAFLDGAGAPIGNPTEGALLLWMRAQGVDYAAEREKCEIVNRLTFTTERKYMATIADTPTGRRLFVKGAPEIVRAMCEADGRDDAVLEDLRRMQNGARRTIAMAVAETSSDNCQEAIASAKLRFVAVAGIFDPVREDVPAAVGECLSAGIAVKIITGDTSATAREIARRIGLWDDRTDGPRNEITGSEFAAMSDKELLGRVRDIKIMSRACPLDKQRMVKLLQQLGEVVAVTGDGTNDAPALNFADVGLSMGTGTAVAKEASDITLLDDSFRSIATAVLWGRSLYDNIRRFVMFQLTINFVAIAVVFIGSLFGEALPLTVTQILWVNLIMDTFAAMAMASLPPRREVMQRPPRHNDDFIVSRTMFRTILSTTALFTVVLLTMLFVWSRGGGVDVYHLTLFFTTFVFMQFWNMFNVRVYGIAGSMFKGLSQCRTFFFVLLVIAVGQWFIVEFGGEVFRTIPISLRDWAIVIAATSLTMWYGMLVRALSRKSVGQF